MSGNHNKRQHELDRLDHARKLWSESEWRLQHLGTETGKPLPERTNEQLLEWMKQCQNQQSTQRL